MVGRTVAGRRADVARWERVPVPVRRVVIRSRRLAHLSRSPRPHVGVELLGDVALIRFDDGKVNVISRHAAELLARAHEQVTSSDGVAAVVLAGRPGQFSAGFDLDTLMIGGPEREQLLETGWDMLERYATSPLPLVVACTGNAIAAGAALLLAGDVRVGAEGHYAVGFNEASIGLPLPGLLLRLARDRLAPEAYEQATAGARMHSPAEAVAAGFLDRLAPGDAVVATAVAEAGRLARLPARSFGAEKARRVAERKAFIRSQRAADLELMRHLGG